MKGHNMKHPRLSLMAAAASAVVLTSRPEAPDREPVIRESITQLWNEGFLPTPAAANGAVPYDYLRQVWQLGYDTRDHDGRKVMGTVGTMLGQLKPVIDACAAQMASGPTGTADAVPDAWRADFDALRAFLTARDRKCDDGDALQAYADAETVLTRQLGISTRLDRVQAAFAARLERQRAAHDVTGTTATITAQRLIERTQ